ncbi:peptidoglycan editing factor PgeF [bacterium]|nr:peptidoglycan editing factor PgeF [bacterium]
MSLQLNYPFSLDNQSGPAYLRVAASATLTLGFGLRSGGLSQGPFASANMSYSVGDEAATVTENRHDLLAGVGNDSFSTLVTCKQVHGNCCKVVTGSYLETSGQLDLAEADALLTAEPGILLGILTADCLPLIIIDKKERAVAVVHAGWRGLEKGVAVEVVAEFARLFSVPVADLLVYAGPAIGACCFEVGIEVIERFARLPELRGVKGWYREQNSGFHLDLVAVQKSQLLAAGIAPDNFHAVAICTCCQDFCFSYRRDHAITGRQLAFAGIANK